MDAKLYRAARDHLQQADAILSRADGDALSERSVIRYVVLMLNEKAETASGNVITLAGFRASAPRSTGTRRTRRCGRPGGNRTRDHSIKSRMLYPELPAHWAGAPAGSARNIAVNPFKSTAFEMQLQAVAEVRLSGCGACQSDATGKGNSTIFPISRAGQRNGRRVPDPSAPLRLLERDDQGAPWGRDHCVLELHGGR